MGSSFNLCLKFFKSYQLNQEKAYDYGFVENSGVWTYNCQILDGDFVMTVSITADNVSFQVFDQETGDSILKFIWKV